LNPDGWLFSMCGVVLILGGWCFYPFLNKLLALGPDDPLYQGHPWLLAIVGLCQVSIGFAWIITFLAMAGEFNEYMFGPWPEGNTNADLLILYIRLIFGVAIMLGFVGTTARWAWYKGYNHPRKGYDPLSNGPFDF
jgi:hypothetical protein